MVSERWGEVFSWNGVDLINVDDLAGGQEFLLRYERTHEQDIGSP